jgi:hypothetical protein
MQQTRIIYRHCARVLAKPQQQIARSSRNPSKLTTPTAPGSSRLRGAKEAVAVGAMTSGQTPSQERNCSQTIESMEWCSTTAKRAAIESPCCGTGGSEDPEPVCHQVIEITLTKPLLIKQPITALVIKQL